MRDLAHRPHHAGLVPGLEELDRLQRAGHIHEQPLELRYVSGLGGATGCLEWTRVRAARERELVQHDDDGVGEGQRGGRGIARDRHGATTTMESPIEASLGLNAV